METEYAARATARSKRRDELRAKTNSGASFPFTYDAALAFLDERGIAPFHSREGSMPQSSLIYMETALKELELARPLLGLHIGNFVGVSLAFLANALRSLNPESKVMSIDPNLTHRGISRPSEVVASLLQHFGLENSVGILLGYSLEKSISNDGSKLEGYDPVKQWASEIACGEQLKLLQLTAPGRFDVCLIDGNHDDNYLRRELDIVRTLLRPGGLLVLDDVAAPWPEIQAVFNSIAPSSFTKLGSDGRIGLLSKI